MLDRKHSVLSTYIYTLKLLWQFNKGYFVGCLMKAILSGIVPVINVYFPMLIVQSITDHNFNAVLQNVALMTGINLAVYIAQSYFTAKEQLVRNLFTTHLSLRILEKTANLDQSLLDDKDIHDLRQKANETISRGHGLNFASGAFSAISLMVTMIPIIILLMPLGILAFSIVLVFLAVDITSQMVSRKMEYKFFLDTNEENREANYFSNVLGDVKHRNDLKMYSLTKIMIRKYEKVKMSILTKFKKMYFGVTIVYVISSIAALLSTAFIYILLGYNMIFRGMSFATFTLYFGAINQLIGSSQQFRQIVIQSYQSCIYIDHFRVFMLLENVIANDNPKENVSIQKFDLSKDLVLNFENVSFTYPQGTNKVLDNANLTLEKGKFYVMVGANGSGKTTIVKLLCRLYDTTDGKILLNNTDIKSFDYKDYRRAFGVVFQDFSYYNMSIKENITFEENTIHQNLLLSSIRLSGLESRVSVLKNGLDHFLGKLFDKDGVEFSGGECQKLAIARALYHKAEIFVLDEPSSALDPNAEYDLIQTFLKLRDEGKTVLFISHRLSTVNYADEVIFIDQGRAAQGTHNDLMQCSEKYNEMYVKQSSLYLK